MCVLAGSVLVGIELSNYTPLHSRPYLWWGVSRDPVLFTYRDGIRPCCSLYSCPSLSRLWADHNRAQCPTCAVTDVRPCWCTRLRSCSRMRNAMWRRVRDPNVYLCIVHRQERRSCTVLASPLPLQRVESHAVSTSRRNATWLILPVVICLSQRLSHACVSMN